MRNQNPKSHAASPKTTAVRPKELAGDQPWICRHLAGRSDIEAYIVEQGGRRTIAEVPASACVNAREVATFITKAVNAYERNCDIIAGVETVLEAFLERKRVDFSVEHDAEVILQKIRKSR